MQISSIKNQKIKDLIKLREGKNRRRQGRFIIEGEREFFQAVDHQLEIIEVFVYEPALSPELLSRLSSKTFPKTYVSHEVFQKIVIREGSGGICAVGACRYFSLEDIVPSESSEDLIFLASEGVEKPGNLGAILRTADGAGVAAVLVLDEVVDVYNPNCIRASLGAVFSIPVIQCSGMAFKKFCEENHIAMAAASPFASDYYFEKDFRGHTAIILGSEAKGLSKLWDDSSLIKIPMAGMCDSLNVSVAAAIILYDVVRQKYKASDS